MNWKKSFVVIALLATIGGLIATQYLQSRVDIEISLSEKYADLQFVAYDLSPAGNYVLKNVSNKLVLSLGTYCWHYRATYTATFALAWVKSSGAPLLIKEIKFVDPQTGQEITNVPIKIYLHKHSNKPSESGWGVTPEASADTKKYFDNGPVTVTNGWVLEPIQTVSYSTAKLMATTDGSTTTEYTATWMQPPGEGYIWISDDAGIGQSVDATYLQDKSNYDTDGGANFVWVEIIIDPNSTALVGSYNYRMIIVVELLPL